MGQRVGRPALQVARLLMGAGVPLPPRQERVGPEVHLPQEEGDTPRSPLCSGPGSLGTAGVEAVPWAAPGAWARTGPGSCNLPGNAVAVAAGSPTQEGAARSRVGAAGSPPGAGVGIRLLGAAGNHPLPAVERWGAPLGGCTAGSLLQAGIQGTGGGERDNYYKFVRENLSNSTHDT